MMLMRAVVCEVAEDGEAGRGVEVLPRLEAREGGERSPDPGLDQVEDDEIEDRHQAPDPVVAREGADRLVEGEAHQSRGRLAAVLAGDGERGDVPHLVRGEGEVGPAAHLLRVGAPCPPDVVEALESGRRRGDDPDHAGGDPAAVVENAEEEAGLLVRAVLRAEQLGGVPEDLQEHLRLQGACQFGARVRRWQDVQPERWCLPAGLRHQDLGELSSVHVQNPFATTRRACRNSAVRSMATMGSKGLQV